MSSNNEEQQEKKRKEKHDLTKNPDKYRIRKFDPAKYERVLTTFPNGTSGWVERRKSGMKSYYKD